MIYDCFTFFNELDLLEIRLNTLAPVVDKFVIAEATRTHSGKPKELLFEKNRERYAAFADKIIYIVVDDLLPEEEVSKDTFNNAFVNENRQRNALANALGRAVDEDVVLISDLDEIPRPEAVLSVVDRALRGEIVRFKLQMYNYFLNYKSYRYPWWLIGTQMLSVGTIRHASAVEKVVCNRFVQRSVNIGHTMTKVRFVNHSYVVPNGGWHFTYMGGLLAVKNKLSAIAESEAQRVLPNVEKRLAAGENIFGGTRDAFGVPLDDGFPKFLLENKERFRDLIFNVTEDYLKRTAFARRIAYARGVCYRFCVRLVPGFLVGPLSKVMIRIRMR